MLGALALGPIPAADAADVCWSPQSLHDVEGGQLVQKNIRNAYVPVPRSEVLPAPAGFRPINGVVRRVTLPKGAPKLIALTFDLCEQPYEISGYQGKVVDFLMDNAIKATFFAGGKWMLTHTMRTQQLMSDPLFEVANHTWEHRNLHITTGTHLEDEIRGAQAAYELARTHLVQNQCVARDGRTLQSAAPARMSLFRFPFGACSPEALNAVSENGLIAIQWDVSSGDPDQRLSAHGLVENVVRRVRSGSIVLFHANGRGWATSDALPTIVAELKKADYRFVTVSELLNYSGAQWMVSDTCYDSHPGDTDHYDGLSRSLETSYQRFYARFAGKQRQPSDRAPDALDDWRSTIRE
jgi:peptidoglycan/xylan/chitin deacetylase (PgdA/CDA1 family)